MKPEFEIKNDAPRRIVYVRLSGLFDEVSMQAWVKAYRTQGTAQHSSRRHMVIADMRGMKTMRPAVAALMGDEIGCRRPAWLASTRRQTT